MSILLKNGLVYDGTLNKPKQMDIHIVNGIIKNIGNNLETTADKIIDCTNMIISPGFIDAHSHNDFFINEEEILPFLKQGITTQIVGNCGTSAFGVNEKSQFKSLVGSGLFETENPSDLNSFITRTNKKLLVNLVPLIGHGTTRISLSGYQPQALTKQQLQEQINLVETAMQQGAFGGSLGLMYEPGMYASREELIEFAKAIKKYDGILTVHTRANSKIALGYPLLSKKTHIELGLEEVIDIMKETKVKLQYSHLIFVGKSSWKCVDPMLKRIKEIQDQGYDIGYDLYPFTYGASVITVILPSWYLKLSKADRKKPFYRFKLNLIINITKKLLGIDFSDLIISFISQDYPQYEGRNIEEIAHSEKVKPIDMYIKLVELSEGKGGIMLGRYYNEDIILRLMNDDLSLYMTDAWYEKAGTQNAGAFQAFLYFLQKTKQHNIDLEKTIHKMTGATAERFKIKNRGYIKEGYAADITVFNFEEIKINLNKPDETPPGIKYVIVNGEVIIENNNYTNLKKGIVLQHKL